MIGPREHAEGLLQEDRGANTDSGSVSSESTSVKYCSVTFSGERPNVCLPQIRPDGSNDGYTYNQLSELMSLLGLVIVKDRLIVKAWMTWRPFCPWKAHFILANDSQKLHPRNSPHIF